MRVATAGARYASSGRSSRKQGRALYRRPRFGLFVPKRAPTTGSAGSPLGRARDLARRLTIPPWPFYHPRALSPKQSGQMVVAEPHDAEGGDGALNSERATTSSQYGAAEGAHARPAQSRAWAFGTVVLMCALVGTAHWAQGVRQTPRELMARGRETYAGQSLHSKIPPPDDYSRKKMSFVKGESHMMNVSLASGFSFSGLCATCAVCKIIHSRSAGCKVPAR